jgi:hypothetical protein
LSAAISILAAASASSPNVASNFAFPPFARMTPFATVIAEGSIPHFAAAAATSFARAVAPA